MRVVWNSRFRRAFKKLIKKNPELQNRITRVLILLAEDPLTPSLKSHKLTGNLSNLWSCSVTYDCRIIFILTQDEDAEEAIIILVDIGSHDEVY
ncbi:MAG: type II toxin-antitoxin system mRNA interferase toxin, RelE/StbE family [Crocosphaera sp.]|uniref:type II toxin-antitoxin system RelE/ParE family toxin n=1 Tax=Crocosphaera sp. TaxID=2729996 RepID=UPI003F22F4B3|nr:type II toxin-antitoxin system mRNA interferase toxin, RelE/StbE family [Crocosphaera sp.]MDJ0845181.1 type II toxin-antitoxin system mRNA interferase toxin, RelE/StbE family [Crocosphaera sp.]